MITPLTRTRFMSTTATARDACLSVLTPEDLNLSGRARAIWRALKEMPGVMAMLTAVPKVRWLVYRLQREDDRSDPLELLAKVVVQLASLGVPEWFFRRIILFLTEIVDECFAGKSRHSRAELDLMEFEAEQIENAFQHKRLVLGVSTPDEKDAEADAIEREVSIEIVRARTLRREARLARAGLVVAA